MLPPLVRKRPLEAILFLVMALAIVLLPAARQIAGVNSRHYPEWAMFHAASRDQYRVRYFQLMDGKRHPVDRISAFGWQEERPYRLTIRDEETVRKQGRKLCKKLEVRELFAEVHRSTMSGWKRVDLNGQNLCARRTKIRERQ